MKKNILKKFQINRKILFLSFIFFNPLISFSQQNNTTNGEVKLENLYTQNKDLKSAVQPKVINKKIQTIDLYKFDQALQTQNYSKFYEDFAAYNHVPTEQLKYLETKIYDGHAPIYWLVSDLNSKLGNDYETHKWLYIAIIMTKQDSELCSDYTSKNAVNFLLKAFPKAVDITKTTPQNIKPAMDEVIFFLNNLKQRSNPIWACSYGTKVLENHQLPLSSPQLWDATRKRVFDEFTKDFRK